MRSGSWSPLTAEQPRENYLDPSAGQGHLCSAFVAVEGGLQDLKLTRLKPYLGILRVHPLLFVGVDLTHQWPSPLCHKCATLGRKAI